MDRLETRTDPVGAGEFFLYDRAGNLIRHTDRKGQQTTFSYDGLNRRTGASFADGSTTSFIYAATGRLIQASDSVGGTILNQYDTLDRLLAQVTGLGTVSYQYDALGRRTTMSAPGQAPVSYGNDAASRLTAITQGAQLVSLAYDPAGRRTRLTLPNGVSTEYQYDVASRLTALIYRNTVGPLGNLTYQYDPAGNRASVSGTFARTLVSAPVASAAYDAANRQNTFDAAALTYDRNGNLTGDGTTTYTWDARNRLTAVTGPTPASFVYDGLGRRTRKTINGVTTADFLYDGVDVQTELQADTQVPYLRTLSIDEALGRGAGEFYLADALGSTVALTSQDGTVTTAYTYAPFGTTMADSPTDPNPFQFTGREHDGTGLYFYRARYHHVGLRRFVSEDPIGMWDGENLYLYVGSNPVSRVDPFGLDWEYAQATGRLTYVDNQSGVRTLVGMGYSGYGEARNNPAWQYIEGEGPIPQGVYTIGPQQLNVARTQRGLIDLPASMRLDPRPGTRMHGRAGFLIHGGNFSLMNSSRGCIVLPPEIRNRIGMSGDITLRVVP